MLDYLNHLRCDVLYSALPLLSETRLFVHLSALHTQHLLHICPSWKRIPLRFLPLFFPPHRSGFCHFQAFAEWRLNIIHKKKAVINVCTISVGTFPRCTHLSPFASTSKCCFKITNVQLQSFQIFFKAAETVCDLSSVWLRVSTFKAKTMAVKA